MTSAPQPFRYVLSLSILETNSSCFIFLQQTKCGACERERAASMVQMFGQPYNQNTLKPVPPSEQASMNRVRFHDFFPQNSLFTYFSIELLCLRQMWTTGSAVPYVAPPKASDVWNLLRRRGGPPQKITWS